MIRIRLAVTPIRLQIMGVTARARFFSVGTRC
jgi:hypothetical protein